MQDSDTWILEVVCRDQYLNLSLYEREQVSPLKAINTIPIDFSRIECLNSEIIALINRATKKKKYNEGLLNELKKNARLLYDLILPREIKNRLSSLGSVNLILSLDERLISIPWEILFDGRDFLCLKFNLGRSIRTQNFSIQVQYRSIPEKPKMLILANPTGDLRSAYQEGIYIKNCLIKRGRINVDFKAQEIDSNYVRKNLRDYDIIHFAGHCEYNYKNPQESGWILSDGWVSARDFLTLGESSALPSMIFANACQSARASSDILDSHSQSNIYSLAQAFLFAGARHYMGSFWRLDDDFSAEFAEEFYNQISNTQSIGKAVRLARLRLFNRYNYSIAWAGYVLYGDPSFVLFKPKRVLVSFRNRIRLHLPTSIKRRISVFGLGLAVIVTVLTIMKNAPSVNPKAYLLYSRAERLYTEGGNNKAIILLNQITEREPTYLSAWRLRGDIYFRLGKFSEALGDYFDYARLSEKEGNHKHLASAYIKIAWIYHMWGFYQKSKEFYQKALNLSQRHRDELNQADAMARLAVWYIDKGENEAAFSLLMKSSEINRQRNRDPEHRFNLACDYFNIGFLYAEREDYSAAKDFFKKSKEIFDGLNAIPELSDYYFDMGEIALFEKNYNLALEYYQKGLNLDKKLDHRFNLSSDYWMLGEFYWETGKLTEAENYFKEAIFICREINNRPVLAGVYYDLGLMYKQMGKIQEAKDYLSLSLDIYKHIDTPDYQQVKEDYLALE